MTEVRPTSPDVFWQEDVHLDQDLSQQLTGEVRPSHQAELEADQEVETINGGMIGTARKRMRPHEYQYVELDDAGRPVASGVQTSLDRWVVSMKQPRLVGYALDKKLRERCPEEYRADFDGVCAEWWDRRPTTAEKRKYRLTPDWEQLKCKMAVEARAASRGSRSRLVEAKMRFDCRCVAALPQDVQKTHLASTCGCVLQMHRRFADMLACWNDEGAKHLGQPYGGSSSLSMGKVQQVEDDNSVL